MTLCCESQTGDSGVLMTKHLLGVSGYERRSHFCSLCLACLAMRQLETLSVSALVKALRSPQKWVIYWTNTGNVNIFFISWSRPLRTLVRQKRDWRLSPSLYREGFAVGSAKGEKDWLVAGWNKLLAKVNGWRFPLLFLLITSASAALEVFTFLKKSFWLLNP